MQSIIYQAASVLHSVVGYWGAILLPVSILVVMIVLQFRSFSFSLPLFATFFILFPAFTPLVTGLLGYKFFTMLNYALQADEVLKIAAVFLITTFAIFFILGSMLPVDIKFKRRRNRHIFSTDFIFVILALNLLLILLFLESGSVLTQGYGAIKHENEAPYSSLVNQFFNACVAFFLCYISGDKRKRMIIIFYLLMIAVFLIFSRRTIVIGLVLLLIYSFGNNRFTPKQLLTLVIAAVLLFFIGEARNVGIINYIQGMRWPTTTDLFFSLPGGASNVFVGTMGVIDLLGRQILAFPETLPILQWPLGRYESTIYGELYQYNGGMHIANVFYWNFGLLGIAVGGLGLGWITMRVHIIASRVKYDMGGTLAGMLSFGFILVLPNVLWYNPIALVKLSIALVIFYAIFNILKNSNPEHGN